MDTIKKYESIERYLTNEMSESERRDFENQLKSDKELYDEVLVHKDLGNLFNNKGLHKFLDTVHETDSNWKLPLKKNRPTFIKMDTRLIIGIAASLLIIVFSWHFLIDSGGSLNSEQLFADNYEPYQIVLSQRSESESTGNVALLNRAIQAYADGNYTSAADAFRQLETLESENISYKFYFALSLLSSNNASEAIEILEKLLETPDHLFAEQSRWYLALAYILTNETDQAIEILQSIKPGQFQYAQSREIISELE